MVKNKRQQHGNSLRPLLCSCGLARLYLVILESVLVSPVNGCKALCIYPCSAAAMPAVICSVSNAGLLYVILVPVSPFVVSARNLPLL